MRIDPRKVDSHIKDNKPHLASLGQPAYVGQLQGHVVHAVEKSGNNNFTAEKLALGEYLVHQDAGVGGFQHGDTGHHLGETAVSPYDPRSTKRGQLEDLFHRNAHFDTPRIMKL